MRAGVDTVLFIHGFNYSFHEALIDAALLKRTYETAETPYTFFVFSWPSDGSLMPYIAYANDRADARTSGAALGRGLLKLGEFVRRVSGELGPRVRSDLGRDAEAARLRKELCAGRLHLMAHSMGAYALRHAVQGMRRGSRRRPAPPVRRDPPHRRRRRRRRLRARPQAGAATAG